MEPEENDLGECDEDEANSMGTESELSQGDESLDDVSTKKRKMEAALRKQDRYVPAPKSYSTEQLYNSPPPAYATFASNRNKGRSEPSLDPYADYDDAASNKSYQLPNHQLPRRLAFESYDENSSESSEIVNRKRGEPRSSSFRRALIPGLPSQPEPVQPYQPKRRKQPRKYRSLEKAVNEIGKPPSYNDGDDDSDDDVGSHLPSLPPEYRSDSGRDSSDADHERTPFNPASNNHGKDRAESPTLEYDSDSSSEKDHLTNGKALAQPEILSYSSFV